MSVKISMGTKKKSYPSIVAAALAQCNKTGENFKTVYMRAYMRMRAGVKPVTAMSKPARKYVRRNVEQVQQVGA